jgi:hypothetical protein
MFAASEGKLNEMSVVRSGILCDCGHVTLNNKHLLEDKKWLP